MLISCLQVTFHSFQYIYTKYLSAARLKPMKFLELGWVGGASCTWMHDWAALLRWPHELAMAAANLVCMPSYSPGCCSEIMGEFCLRRLGCGMSYGEGHSFKASVLA